MNFLTFLSNLKPSVKIALIVSVCVFATILVICLALTDNFDIFFSLFPGGNKK